MNYKTQAAQNAIRRLTSDLKELQQNPIALVSASPLEDNIFEVRIMSCFTFVVAL